MNPRGLDSLNNPALRWLLPALLVLLTAAEKAAPEPLDKEQAQSRLAEVVRAIADLKARLESSRADQRKEQAQLKQLDLAIQKTSLELRQLNRRKGEHEQKLAGLEEDRDVYMARLGERLEMLADQVNAAYRTSGRTRLRLILNQDDPQKLGRMLAYYDYLNRAQLKKISQLKEALTTLQGMQQSIDRELQRIDRVQKEQSVVLGELEQQRQERQNLFALLSDQIRTGEAQLKELQRNQADLEALLERLSDVLADIPPDLGDRAGIAGRKGRLPMPVTGPVRHAFGQTRMGDMRWQGWLIGAKRGAEVRSVAYGRVAFADWLRGYGLLLIIDHGQGYMSLYGHNESLLHDVGSWVEAGEAVSTVGENPGNEQGLYFELRSDGKAVDPAAWLKR